MQEFVTEIDWPSFKYLEVLEMMHYVVLFSLSIEAQTFEKVYATDFGHLINAPRWYLFTAMCSKLP